MRDILSVGIIPAVPREKKFNETKTINLSPGEMLRTWRKVNRLTQIQAAGLVGADQSTWCRWERGDKFPSEYYANAIERLTKGVCPAKIFLEEKQ